MADTAEKTFADLGPVKHSWSSIVAHDYVAFTPALMYWGTNLDRDMVRDFAATLDRSTRILACDAPMPIFDITNSVSEITIQCGGATGEKVEKIDWSRRMYFCPKSIWPQLRVYLGRYGTFDKNTMRYSAAVECPVITIPDYMRLAEGYVPPGFIPMSSIGMYATDGCSMWRWDEENHYSRPKAVKIPPTELVRYDGMMFFQER